MKKGVVLLLLFSAGCTCGMDLDHFSPEQMDAQQDPDMGRDDPGHEIPDIPPDCGNGIVDEGEECDDANADDFDGCRGDCSFTCHGHGECADANPCTDDKCIEGGTGKLCRFFFIEGYCDDMNPCTEGDYCDEGGNCVGWEVACNDDDECTRDFCDPGAGGCVFEPLPVWFRDEDGDGFGHMYDNVCSPVAPDGYVDNRDDCCDINPDVHPAQGEFFTQPFECGPASIISYDYNCSGEHEQRWNETGFCDDSCNLHEGWQDDTIPGCGEAAAFVIGCDDIIVTCVTAIDAYRRQQCH